MSTLSISVRHNPDPLICDDFAYGLGPPTGVLVLRYAIAAETVLADRRDDLLHQVFWSPDGTLRVTGEVTGELTDEQDAETEIGPDRAFWVHRARSHLVVVPGPGTVYRMCLRQVPRRLDQLWSGVVRIEEEAARHLVLLGTGGVRDGDWRRSRRIVMDGLEPVDAGAAAVVAPTGAAGEVARALVSDPGDPRTLAEWAAELHVSVKTLQREFSRAYGMSFSAWRTATRLAAARELLKVVPVGEVARRVGYLSTSAFVAAFSRAYGCTPGSISSGTAAAARRSPPAEPAPGRRAART